MKKILVILLCLLFVVAGCSSPAEETKTTEVETQAATPAAAPEPEPAPEPIYEYTPPEKEEASSDPDPEKLSEVTAVARPAEEPKEEEVASAPASNTPHPLEHNDDQPATSTQGVDRAEFNAVEMLEGEFSGTDLHRASGMVKVIERDGKRILLLRDLSTDDGPDLKIYLATDNTASDFIDLRPLRKNDKGLDIEIDLDESVDLEKYNHALVWCKKFGVLFAEAKLQ